MNTIILGADSTERLFLKPAKFIKNNITVRVIPTQIDPISRMPDLIARHRGRYYFLGLFLRPKCSLLDFPCGSGYGAEILREFNIYYEGRDKCPYTIEYAKRNYGNKKTSFICDDLEEPNIPPKYYDVIACIEGLEHIQKTSQIKLIERFYHGLVPKGTLIITSPEPSNNKSGESKDNSYHLWELTKEDLLNLLYVFFKKDNIEIITQKDKLHNGRIATCFYVICHKE